LKVLIVAFDMGEETQCYQVVGNALPPVQLPEISRLTAAVRVLPSLSINDPPDWIVNVPPGVKTIEPYRFGSKESFPAELIVRLLHLAGPGVVPLISTSSPVTNTLKHVSGERTPDEGGVVLAIHALGSSQSKGPPVERDERVIADVPVVPLIVKSDE